VPCRSSGALIVAKTVKMWGISTAFLFLYIGLAASEIQITPSLSLGKNNHTNLTSVTPSPSSVVPTSAHHNFSTSIVPSNTTVVPVSTSVHSNTTTPKPTTTPMPTTTPAPLNTGDYSVKDKDGKYCLLAHMNATFEIIYEQKVPTNATKKQGKVEKTVPFKPGAFSTKGSKCDKSKPLLKITWEHYDFEVEFEMVVNTSNWKVSSLKLTAETVNNTDFRNATEKTIVLTANTSEVGAISAGVKGYYACSPDHTYDFDNKEGKLFLENVKLRPFVKNSTKEETFGSEFNCVPPTPTSKPDDNNIVPIAVGCALAGLVLIVLIAYIIGRRKSQRGYEKV